MASERVVALAFAQVSILSMSSLGMRAATIGSFPVGGRPIRLGLTDIDFLIVCV